MPWIVSLAWSLAVTSLLLGLSAIPLARTAVSSRVWWTHGTLAVLVGATMTVTAHAQVYRFLIPWWQTGAGYLAVLSAPVITAGWAARVATRRWPGRGWWPPALAALAAMVLVGAAGTRVAAALLPEVINAVQ